jgi:pimeloyl-ACP methyl ester carboxylesterase
MTVTVPPVPTAVSEGAYLDAGGFRTHYHDAGEGAPVLLVHGSGPGVSAWANWRHCVPVLAEVARVVAPDLVGYGASDKPNDLSYGLRLWTNHVWAFLDALGLDRVSVVGNSLGGRIALQMAADHPERLDRLVLMGTPGVGMRPTEGLKALRAYQPSMDNMRDLLTRYFAVDQSIITDDLVRIRYEASAAPGAHEAYTQMFADPNSAQDLAITEEQARAVDLPTLIVHGAVDRVVPVDVAWTMFNMLPDADLQVFARCGHWTQIERATDFNAAVIRFLGLVHTERGVRP